MNRFVYIIYDIVSGEIWEIHMTEDECVRAYNETYEGYKNIDWMGFNLSFWVKEFFIDRAVE